MLRKYLAILGVLLGAANFCQAFSLLIPLTTPATAWQTTALGYNVFGTEIGGVGNTGEEYRWNLHDITYAFDDSFLNYFGVEGIDAVETALAMISGIGPVSSLSPNLDEFVLNPRLSNPSAGALGVVDVKSTTLAVTLELLGLANSFHYVYTLRQRSVVGNPPVTNYFVILRNFDPVTYEPSTAINFDSYNFNVVDPIVTNGPNGQVTYADAVEFSANGVPEFLLNLPATLGVGPGMVLTGLSRDDAGGLRYLYRGNNYNMENLVPGITLASNNVANIISPWVPYIGITNILTNIFGTTNITGTNVIVDLALRPGIETLSFARVNYDSLLSQTFVPITNIFTDVIISNNAAVMQRAQRVTTQPDLLFTAEDVGFYNGGGPILVRRTVNFINNDQINGQSVLAGPGVLSGPARIAFNNILPGFFGSTSFLGGGTPSNAWGSFDETTQAEDIVIYPDGFSIQELERLVLGQ